MANPAVEIARGAKNSRPLNYLARSGFAVSGLVHLTIGSIAINLAIGTRSGEPDQTGALGELVATPFGGVLLWATVIGLTALGIRLLLRAFFVSRPDAKRTWMDRIVAIAKGVVYLIFAATASVFALGGTTNAAQGSQGFSAALLSTPGGVLLLVSIGLGVFGIGIYHIYKGVARKFTDDVTLPSGPIGQAGTVLGIAGYTAKGIALDVVGVLSGIAALTVDPGKATGLDGH